ncbi:protein phosphatase 2C domain-containing protein [Glaesserella parasuis]|uniref:protein phosphatase 2C domain-containing protein n=1 Tax=Glaesserella parasuis TaxID=738 RepID=UPI0024368D89|nr:protein phosphatase 2C domain-containing protein [Glaesserella parasuis]MDG6309577.1 protein phosphatase 2C domain-containing protein [Glaesserella parasuis]
MLFDLLYPIFKFKIQFKGILKMTDSQNLSSSKSPIEEQNQLTETTNVPLNEEVLTNEVSSGEEKTLSDEERLKEIAQQKNDLAQEEEELKKKIEQEKLRIAEPAPIALLDRSWKAEYEAVVGLKHRKPMPPQPCQDAALAVSATDEAPFSVVISADGAGSCPVSDIGSQRVVSGVYRLIHTLYRSQFNALDEDIDITDDIVKRWALILTKHAKGILDDLAKEYRRENKDFCCTLLVGLTGKCHTFWFKVGDGALVKEVAERGGDNQIEYKLEHLGDVGKGEYANETVFISPSLNPDKVQYGIFKNLNLSGLVTMSDGAAFKLVSNDGQNVALSLSTLLQNLRENKLLRMHLTKFFYTEKFLEGHDGDDCSIALIAR